MVERRDGNTSHTQSTSLILHWINLQGPMYCEVAPMDVGHIIFGRPWQYDRETIHDGKRNTYRFVFHK